MPCVSRVLWFGDERGYNATSSASLSCSTSCGLVMKEDITQPCMVEFTSPGSCGLVMKEDITQLRLIEDNTRSSCGLVMKEDITQLQTHKPL